MASSFRSQLSQCFIFFLLSSELEGKHNLDRRKWLDLLHLPPLAQKFTVEMRMWIFILELNHIRPLYSRKTTSSRILENKRGNAHFQQAIGKQRPHKDQWDLSGAGGHCRDVRITRNCHIPATSRVPPASDALETLNCPRRWEYTSQLCLWECSWWERSQLMLQTAADWGLQAIHRGRCWPKTWSSRLFCRAFGLRNPP